MDILPEMLRNIRYIFGLAVLVALLSACSKDADLYTPQRAHEQQEKPSAFPMEPSNTNSGGKDNGITGATSSNTSSKPTSTSTTGHGSNGGNISISDDDDDEDDDN